MSPENRALLFKMEPQCRKVLKDILKAQISVHRPALEMASEIDDVRILQGRIRELNNLLSSAEQVDEE